MGNSEFKISDDSKAVIVEKCEIGGIFMKNSAACKMYRQTK